MTLNKRENTSSKASLQLSTNNHNQQRERYGLKRLFLTLYTPLYYTQMWPVWLGVRLFPVWDFLTTL